MYCVSQRHSKASYRKPLSEIPRVFPKATFTLFHCIRALGNKIFWPHYSQLSYPRLGCWAVLHWGRGEEGDAGRKHSSLPRHSAKPISGGEVTVTQLSQTTDTSAHGIAEQPAPSTWLKHLSERGNLPFTCSSLGSMLLPWILLISWLWLIISKIVLHFWYPQKNTSRYRENAVLIPCPQEGSQVFFAGRAGERSLSIDNSELLLISHLEEVPFPRCPLPTPSAVLGAWAGVSFQCSDQVWTLSGFGHWLRGGGTALPVGAQTPGRIPAWPAELCLELGAGLASSCRSCRKMQNLLVYHCLCWCEELPSSLEGAAEEK